MFLFGRNKTPQELVKALKELLTQLERGEKKYDKVSKRIVRFFTEHSLCGYDRFLIQIKTKK